MNSKRIEANWTMAKGETKEQWGRLTDDEIERMAGETEQLVDAFQRRCGCSPSEARDEAEQWRRASGF